MYQVVARAVALELREHGLEALVLDDVPVVELVLQADARAEEAQRGEHEALVTAAREAQHLGEHVVAQDEVLDPIRVLLHAEGQQLAHVLLCREHAVPARARAQLHLRLGLRVAVHGRRPGLRPARDRPRELVHELVVEEVEQVVLLAPLHPLGIEQAAQHLRHLRLLAAAVALREHVQQRVHHLALGPLIQHVLPQ